MDWVLPILALMGTGLAGVIGAAIGWVARRPSNRPNAQIVAWQTQSLEAMNAVPDWAFILQDEQIVDSNSPSLCPFPKVNEHLVGQDISAVFPTHGLSVLISHLERCQRKKRPVSFEFLHGPDTNRYAEARLFPLQEGRTLVVTRDKTDQKFKEETLHRSKERYALAVQGANDGLWDWNLRTNEVYYSYQWKTIVGYEGGETINKPNHWFDRVHPDDVASMQAALKAHLDGEAPRFESEHRFQMADGSWLWALVRGMAVRDSRGAAKRIAGSITDLTNRRAVAVSVEKANLLERATASVGIGIALLSPKNTLEGAGEQMRRMTEEWHDLAEWWRDVLEDLEFPPKVRCKTCGVEHWVGTVETEVYRPQTDAFPIGNVELLSRVFEIAIAGHAHEIGAAQSHVLLVKDITQRARAERRLTRANEELVVARDQALAASRAKSAFLANMSHELRTPLNHIIGYAEMVVEELEDLDQKDLANDVERIRSSGGSLLDIISGILDLSRIEAGISGMHLNTFPLSDLVEEVVEALRPACDKRGNTVTIDLANDIAGMHSDQAQVRRIVDALVSNAVKFTQDGIITIEADTLERNQQTWISLVVKDTGIGMSSEQVKGLSVDFYMANATSTKEQGGLGLGLTLAYRFTDMMGGTIDVTSAPDEGSTFRVLLPQALESPTAQA